ncbi:NUDIX domain-containing protein [Clostridium sp. D2Q-14]|uniref:NUDIX domain-containing protein n=1 Tax=Anaeromonas gelatinilytica TaxID=2683194 RepID=UPI00193C4575|nr:NUDIX domain-containing protein [Anaeromonas gelatinilytica]
MINKKGEIFKEGIKREFKEELGATLNDFQLFGIYNNFYESKNDSIVIFHSDDFVIKGAVNREVEKYQFFDLRELPDKYLEE